MSRFSWIWAALAALMLPLAACGGSTTPTTAGGASAPVFPTNVQNCGEQVTIAKEPKRIVTIGYESVELINAAGGANRIVATFDNTQDPDSPAFKAVANPELASDKEPSTEGVIALRPDLVASYGLFDINLASLQQAGAASLIVSGLCGQHGGGHGDGAQFDDIYHDIETYGRLLSTQPQAQTTVEQLLIRYPHQTSHQARRLRIGAPAHRHHQRPSTRSMQLITTFRVTMPSLLTQPHLPHHFPPIHPAFPPELHQCYARDKYFCRWQVS